MTFIQFPDQSANTGKKAETTEVVVGADTVAREHVRLSGGAAGEIAEVKGGLPASNAMGIVTRPIGPIDVNIVADSVGSSVEATDNTAVVTLNSKTLANGATPLVPKFAKIAASASGNNTVVAAVAAKKIRVLALWGIASGTVNAKWQTAAGGTDLTGLAYLVVNSGYVLPFNPLGWFETVAGELLNLNLSAAIAVGGGVIYVEV